MSPGRFELVENKKSNRLQKVMIIFLLLFLIGSMAFFVYKKFSLESIQVEGLTTYSRSEVIGAMKSTHYVDNTLGMIVVHKLMGDTYLPFIEKITFSLEDSHVLKVNVKEKIRAGVFKYMERNVYFDSEGIAQESRNRLFDGVPVVTGVKYDKMVLGEQIPVDGDYFDTIVDITKKIASYQLDISRIHFEDEDDIYLVSGRYQIYIGSRQYLQSKMSKLPEIIKSVKEISKSSVIDMHLYTDDNKIITFYKK